MGISKAPPPSTQTEVTTSLPFGASVFFADSDRAFKVVSSNEGERTCKIAPAEVFEDPTQRQAGPVRPWTELRLEPAEVA